ncbi:MAG: DUF1501 domain-containing protein [Verrucomicrobiales bacterium]
MGHPRQPGVPPARALRCRRPPDRRPDPRSQTTRHARRNLVVWGANSGAPRCCKATNPPRTASTTTTATPTPSGWRSTARRDLRHRPKACRRGSGGVKGGHSRGTTCDLGYSVEENPTEIRDFHAALLHLLGIDHERLTFRYLGLDQRLTGIEEAHLPRDIFA